MTTPLDTTALARSMVDGVTPESNELISALCAVEEGVGANVTWEWVGETPQPTEHKGTRITSQLSETTYAITNKVYTAAIRQSLDAIRRGTSGAWGDRILQFAADAASHPINLLETAIAAGTSGLCYDGAAFFADSHTARGSSGAQDNLLAGTGTSEAQFKTDLATAIAKMRRFKKENGEPFFGTGNLGRLLIVVPPELEFTALSVVAPVNGNNVSGADTVMRGWADVKVASRLTDANDWYLFSVLPGRKPMRFLYELPMSLDYIGEDSETAIRDRMLEWGVSWAGACGYGFWQSAIKTVNT